VIIEAAKRIINSDKNLPQL